MPYKTITYGELTAQYGVEEYLPLYVEASDLLKVYVPQVEGYDWSVDAQFLRARYGRVELILVSDVPLSACSVLQAQRRRDQLTAIRG